MRYFFEVHDADTVEWDQAGCDCLSRFEIEQAAHRRLAAFLERHGRRPSRFGLAVLAASGAVVMTAAGVSREDMQVFWR